MYDLEPVYLDDGQKSDAESPCDGLHYRAGGGGGWLGDKNLLEVLARASGHSLPILVAYAGQVRELTVQCTCDVCRCPPEDVGDLQQDDTNQCLRCELYSTDGSQRGP